MDSKPWWKSVSVWGNVIAIVATAGGFFGYVITPENQAAAAIAAELLGGRFISSLVICTTS